MKLIKTNRSTIPCYAADGMSLGYRSLDAAQRLVSGGYVRPAYGRKGHLRAIWLLRDDGSSPVQARAGNSTRYSYIESLTTGRCWQLRRLCPRDSTIADVSSGSARAPFLKVIRDCTVPSPAATLGAKYPISASDCLAATSLPLTRAISRP
jgi:hypothetical protein